MKYLIIILLLISTAYGQNINYYFQGQQPKDKVPCYNFPIIATTDMNLFLSGTGNVYWGDGDVISYDGSFQNKSHTYSGSFTGTLSICGTLTVLYSLAGGSDLSGDIADIPQTLIQYTNTGSNTTSGDIANLPSVMEEYSNSGLNTTSGDIANLPSVMEEYSNSGLNTTSGDIANLPSGLTSYISNGNNTTSGDIANLPSGLNAYNNDGNNTTTGDIANLPSGLILYWNKGNNTTSGDIADLPSGVYDYLNIGLNEVDTYTSGRTWSAIMWRFWHNPNTGFGLDATEVDNLLIDLDASLSLWNPGAIIDLGGENAARTAASDAAVTSLQGKGVTVQTN